MGCEFKKPNGEKCNLPLLRGSKYCCLHDPESISIYFFRDFKNYKKGEVALGISKERGDNFIKNSVAIKLDKKLYKDIFNKKS